MSPIIRISTNYHCGMIISYDIIKFTKKQGEIALNG